MADIQQDLFSPEEMGKIENSNLHRQQGPVKCLGMEFENDEVRRTYFREELRKKLPELRKIEGFPIGEDDDIINLSDPPYYTACPNPWLNDFIAEWEKEKVQLEAKGKRQANFEVKEPYASDVSEGKRNPIYNAHTYHTKVPFLAIMRYLLHYTQPGDIIIDGFAGTGMTGVAANMCASKEFVDSLNMNGTTGKRNCICSDLSPIASFLSASFNTPIDATKFVRKAKEIINKVKEEYGWLYSTKTPNGKGEIVYTVWSDVFLCPQCGEEIIFCSQVSDIYTGKINDDFECPRCHSKQSKKSMNHLFVSEYDSRIEELTSIAKTVPVLIKYKIGNKTYTKPLDKEDKELLNKIDELPYTDWIPTDKLVEGYNTNQPIKTNGINHLHQFYTKRNLLILGRILHYIGDDEALKFWFTSQLINLSKLNRYRPEVSFPYNPLNGTLYIASQVCESNVFDAYINKLSKMELALKEIKNRNVSEVASATNIPLKSNTIDYIFVDPPFGSNIMYSDLNCIWEGWVKVKTESSKEAIINPVQGKTLFEYQVLMNQSFREFYRILKPSKWMTIEFSNTSASVWNSIQNSLQGVGFIVANVAALDKQQGSFKAVTTTTAVKQDLVITCYKPSDQLIDKIALSYSNKDSVWDFLNEHLAHLPVHIERDNATTTVVERSAKILYDRLVSYYVQHGYQIPMDAQEFQAGLRERFIERDGMYFTAPQAAEYEEKRKHTSDFVPMGLIVSDEANGIEWLKLQLKEPKTYQEISPEWMQAVNGLRKGDVLPELKDILEENFIEDETGRWHVPDLEKQIDLEKLKHKSLMKEFNLYKEMAQKPRARIKEVRVEALREGFKQCFKDKDFATILLLGDKIPQNILTEDEVLLQYYDIAQMRS